VETAIYLPDLDGITAKWRGLGIVLRDMVRITPSGNEILTAGLPLEADGVAAAVMAERRLPAD
jgi:Xaa-Pro aminopeptidase